MMRNSSDSTAGRNMVESSLFCFRDIVSYCLMLKIERTLMISESDTGLWPPQPRFSAKERYLRRSLPQARSLPTQVGEREIFSTPSQRN